MRIWLIMFVLLATGPLMALSVQSSETSEITLIVLPPWTDRAQLLDAIQGFEIGPQSAPFGFLVQSTHGDLASVAYAAGAWWVTDGAGLASICGVES
ncbi:hypothetical protein ACERZ8_07875 [Tateyamaria armeniaca]|uniref:Uncharacterized protein n=1 Tax=Tateyamaria armeniaca TaxID=2518930 RepID=A0ABW8US80_9RHOB